MPGTIGALCLPKSVFIKYHLRELLRLPFLSFHPRIVGIFPLAFRKRVKGRGERDRDTEREAAM